MFSIARFSVSRVTSSSRRASSGTSPIGTVAHVSAQYPLSDKATSSETMSPSFSTRLPGMPWTISSFTLMHVWPGKPSPSL
jgi:hypothetical protein